MDARQLFDRALRRAIREIPLVGAWGLLTAWMGREGWHDWAFWPALASFLLLALALVSEWPRLIRLGHQLPQIAETLRTRQERRWLVGAAAVQFGQALVNLVIVVAVGIGLGRP